MLVEEHECRRAPRLAQGVAGDSRSTPSMVRVSSRAKAASVAAKAAKTRSHQGSSGDFGGLDAKTNFPAEDESGRPSEGHRFALERAGEEAGGGPPVTARRSKRVPGTTARSRGTRACGPRRS